MACNVICPPSCPMHGLHQLHGLPCDVSSTLPYIWPALAAWLTVCSVLHPTLGIACVECMSYNVIYPPR